jgi:hypothetical protein
MGAQPALLAGAVLLLFLIGLGPALHLVGGARRCAQAALVAPGVGLALLGLVLYPLVRADVTVGRAARPLTVAAVLASGVLVALDRRRDGAPPGLNARACAGTAAGAAAVIAALSLPAWRGGLDHTLWQGNDTDAGFYLYVAAYAEEIPWSWAGDRARDQEVVQRSAAAVGGIGLVASEWRPAAALAVAWVAALGSRPVTDTYYVVALLGPALAFPVMLGVAGRLGLRGGWRLAPALVVSTGFWAHALVDMNATGQALSLPLALLLLFAWLQADEAREGPLLTRERGLFALALAAVFGFYAEMMPLLLAALALHAALRWRELGAASVRRAAGVGALAAACLAPALGAHLAYLRRVSSAAFGRTRPGWADYFFPWLYDRDPTLAGLWGLHHWRVAARAGGAAAAAWPVASALLAGGLCLALAALLWRAADARRRPERVLAAGVIAFWGGALALLLRGEPWLAGKAFGYGTPFACAGVFLALARVPPRLRIAGVTVAGAWTSTQVATCLLRLPATRPGGAPIPQYVTLRTEGLDEITRLHLGPGTLAADFTGAPHAERKAWTLYLSPRPEFLPLHAVDGRLGRPLWKETSELPERLLLLRDRDYVGGQALGRPLHATARLVLYALEPEAWDRALVSSSAPAAAGPVVPDAIECDPPRAEPSRCWLVGEDAGLRFLASGRTALRVAVDIVPLDAGRWRVLANGAPAAAFEGAAGVPSRAAFALEPRRGTNWIRLVHGDGTPAGGRSPRGPRPRTAVLESLRFAALVRP